MSRGALRGLAAAALLLAGCGGGSGGAGARLEEPLPSRAWRLAADTPTTPAFHSQGLATLPALGPDQFAFTSRFTLDRAVGEDGGTIEAGAFAFPQSLLDLGFDHLGDPDAHGARIYGGLEDNAEPTVDRYHRALIAYDAETLAPEGWSVDPGAADAQGDGDAPWVALSPDGAWLVSGEWDPQDDLMVFRASEVGAAPEIEAVARIPLDRTIARVQGCDFDGPRVLLCASDDGEAGKPVYAIVLSRGLTADADLGAIEATVETLFPTPLPEPLCGLAEPEVEGVDVEGDLFRVLVIGTCLVDSHVYRFEREGP